MDLTHADQGEKRERAVLISVDTGAFDAQSSISELSQLAETAGAQVLAEIVQKREAPSAATYIGSGLLEQVRELCAANGAELVIADGELSPVQARNIEDFCNVRAVDRTMLILDIFASRARSAEGKIQVELAQLQYLIPRLAGQGKNLSRLGAGIGTRGPGETKLETDRRHIRRRIDRLSESLDKIKKRRLSMHRRRKKNGAESAAIVGYTNAGKSTLMNRLTDAGVLEEDKLFATLDPTARKLTLPDGRQIMLVDTVGLVRRLPHQLVDAFRSTLEEALWADVILNVCDVSNPECSEQVRVTEDLLSSLGCGSKPIINVLNKCDLAPETLSHPLIGRSVRISAKTGFGTDELLRAVADTLPAGRKRVTMLVPFSEGRIADEIRRHGVVYSQSFEDGGIKIEAYAEISYLDKIKDYIL